ncbi:MAG: LapA family protein [Sphingomonadales bacterium]|nr:LapA family protein [Sphingomonadales bacterium]
MKKFIMALPIWVVAVALVFFVVSNRHGVVVNLYPLSSSLEMPLYFVFFMGLFLGLILAGFILLLRRVNAATKMYMAKRENARLRSKVVDMEKVMDEPDTDTLQNNNEQLELAKTSFQK